MILVIILVVLLAASIGVIISLYTATKREEQEAYRTFSYNIEKKIAEKEEEFKQTSEKLNNALQSLSSLEQQKQERVEAQERDIQKEATRLEENLKKEVSLLEKEYADAERACREEYLLLLEESVKTFKEQIEGYQKLAQEAENTMLKEQRMVKSAIDARRRQDEEENKTLFYKLQISENDLEDIQRLNQVAVYLHNPEVLYKTIWKVYYERPYNDLVGRVLGDKEIICGIYKITNTLNGKSYVGQSNNVKERFRQHIKRGIGAETPTRNKLYPAMLKEGIWNFTFELLEQCPKEELDKQEDFWQNYYDVINYGYSIK